jgi:hypothetical protein
MIVNSVGRCLAALFRGTTAAHAVTHVVGNDHIQSQPAEAVEQGRRVVQAHRIAVKKEHGRPARGGGVRLAVGRQGRAKHRDHALARLGLELEQFGIPARAYLRVRLALRIRSRKYQPGLKPVDDGEKTQADHGRVANRANQAAFETKST